MCLGLYEDTGSFTFPSTTERDFLAAAFLLARGANLNVVSDLIARELNPEQVTLLNDMIQSANRSQVNGVEVVMTSISRETYIPDFAFLVQKMARMENLEAIFALALMESKIYIVARSRTWRRWMSAPFWPAWAAAVMPMPPRRPSRARPWPKPNTSCSRSCSRRFGRAAWPDT